MITNIQKKWTSFICAILIIAQCSITLKTYAALPIHTDEKHVKKLISFIVTSSVISLNRNKIRRNTFIKLIAYYTNTHPKDLIDWAVLGTFCWGASNVPKNRIIEQFLQTFALLNPAVQIISTTKTWQYILSKIPIIQSLFTCHDEQCPGICEQCKFISLYQKAPFCYIPLLIQNKIRKIIKIKHKKEETQRKIKAAQKLLEEKRPDAECPVCMEKPEYPIQVCKNFHFMCSSCKDEWKKHCNEGFVINRDDEGNRTGSVTFTCPSCREPIT